MMLQLTELIVNNDLDEEDLELLLQDLVN